MEKYCFVTNLRFTSKNYLVFEMMKVDDKITTHHMAKKEKKEKI